MKELIALLVIIGIIYLVIRKKRQTDIRFRGRRDNLSGRKKREDSIGDTTVFYGSKEQSPNGKYFVTYTDGHYYNNRWENGNIALLKNGTILFKKKIQRPNDCHVSDNGIVICCDWQNSNALTGRFLIFDSTGKELFIKKTTANLGACAISSDSKFAIFETFSSETEDSNKFFIIDVKQSRIVSTFLRPHSFKTAEINTEKGSIKLKDYHGFIFEIDFNGNHINRHNYEMQVMQEGSNYQKLCLYGGKPDELKFRDQKYLQLLIEALDDKDSLHGFGEDRLYRRIGEYYDAVGDISKAIENWDKAIQINPKVGIKRKLDALKKSRP